MEKSTVSTTEPAILDSRETERDRDAHQHIIWLYEMSNDDVIPLEVARKAVSLWSSICGLTNDTIPVPAVSVFEERVAHYWEAGTGRLLVEVEPNGEKPLIAWTYLDLSAKPHVMLGGESNEFNDIKLHAMLLHVAKAAQC
jgi:hypothetical protein